MKDRDRIDRIENDYLPRTDEQIRDLREALYGRENRNTGNLINFYPTSPGATIMFKEK